jgi:voltage-gated potassium channel
VEAPPLTKRVYQALHGKGSGRLTHTQRFLLATILFAVGVAIVSTEPELPDGVRDFLEVSEIVIGMIFVVEFLARIWSVGAAPEFAGFTGRLRYIVKPIVIIDLIALLPFLLGAVGAESLVLRLVRVMRLLALSKLMRYSEAMKIVVSSVVQRRYELFFAFTLAGMMILFSASALYIIEGETQPKAFGSILRSMWWAVTTLTTVGYGDVVPLTPLGKVFAAMTAIAGIGMIAMPTGILAASFSDGFARAREHEAKKRDER